MGRGVGTQLTRRANERQFMKAVTGELSSRFIEPGRAGRVVLEWTETGVLRQQTGLKLIQLRPDLILQVWPLGLRSLSGRVPRREQAVLNEFVRFDLSSQPLAGIILVNCVIRSQLSGLGNHLRLSIIVLNRLPTVPFGQGDEVRNPQALGYGHQQRFQCVRCGIGYDGIGLRSHGAHSSEGEGKERDCYGEFEMHRSTSAVR